MQNVCIIIYSYITTLQQVAQEVRDKHPVAKITDMVYLCNISKTHVDCYTMNNSTSSSARDYFNTTTTSLSRRTLHGSDFVDIKARKQKSLCSMEPNANALTEWPSFFSIREIVPPRIYVRDTELNSLCTSSETVKKDQPIKQQLRLHRAADSGVLQGYLRVHQGVLRQMQGGLMF